MQHLAVGLHLAGLGGEAGGQPVVGDLLVLVVIPVVAGVTSGTYSSVFACSVSQSGAPSVSATPCLTSASVALPR